jgi:hypothetical protein
VSDSVGGLIKFQDPVINRFHIEILTIDEPSSRTFATQSNIKNKRAVIWI